MIAIARAKYQALKAKIQAEKKKLREQGRDDSAVQVPKDLTDSREYVRKLKARLRRRFKVVKQRLRQMNNRNGECKVGSNVKIHKPDFLRKGRQLMVQNFAEDTMTGRRRLVGLSELDVSRDVMDFKFMTNSDQESEPIEYFLEMKKWDETGVAVQV